MTIPNMRDLIAGSLFFGLGIAIVVIAWGYRLGSAASMGPGFFPVMLGTLLVLLGLAIAIISFRSSPNDEPAPHSVAGLLIVVGAVCLFAIMLDRAGLLLTVFVVAAGSSFLSPQSSLPKALATGAALTALCYGLFIWGLGVPLPVWPSI